VLALARSMSMPDQATLSAPRDLRLRVPAPQDRTSTSVNNSARRTACISAESFADNLPMQSGQPVQLARHFDRVGTVQLRQSPVPRDR